MASITLDQVRKTYDGTVVALESMSLEIADGELIVFVGPSGCGKSTALKMIAGLEEVTSGRIRIGGKDVTDAAPKNRDIAMVFQNYALYPHLSVGRNIGFPLKMRGTPPAEIAARVEAAAKVLGIETLLDRRPRQLSGGQRQRVALGRAIVREPQAFLMDEPLSNLDAKLRVQMRAEIGALHDRLGVTTIYVTHDQIEAMTMADRIVIMRDGLIQQVAEPDEMYAHPANIFVAGFIGSPAMNFFGSTLEPLDDGFAVRLGDSWLPVATGVAAGQRGQRIIVGLRPEHIGNVADAAVALEITPTLVESLGGERYVHFPMPAGHRVALASVPDDEAGGGSMIARVIGQTRIRAGEAIRLGVDTSQLHLFDPDTERSLD